MELNKVTREIPSNKDLTDSKDENETEDQDFGNSSQEVDVLEQNKPDTTDSENTGTSQEPVEDNKGSTENSHPLKHDLDNFEPTPEQLMPSEKLGLYKSIDVTPYSYIETKVDLENVITDLSNEKEIAVDLEYSDHGFKALTCLVQISTREKDHIIDAKVLKEHMHLLSALFANKNIVKIFHDSTNDLKWLQQDFSLFVINMFDTQRAMKRLGYKELGLQAQLKLYGVIKDKSMQRADFRIRPLPPKYIDYARTDTHFLINIYHELKNKLIEINQLKELLSECHNECKIVHGGPEDSYVSIRKNLEALQARQLIALEKINKWRTNIAKYEDRNSGYILSKKSMYTLISELPLEPAKIIGICKSQYVQKHVQEIVKILSAVKPQGKTGQPGQQQLTQSRGSFGRPGNNKFQNRKRKFSGAYNESGGDEFYGNKRRFDVGSTDVSEEVDLRNKLINVPERLYSCQSRPNRNRHRNFRK